MDQNAILKWATGADFTLKSPLDFDESELYRLIELHNLSGRFLDRAERLQDNLFSSQFIDRVRELYTRTQFEVMRNISAVREINSALGANVDLIVIKGISSFVLSGEDRIIRAGDIDVLSSNSSALIDALLKLNFVQTRVPFLHELGEYSKNGVEVDVHDHFPVYSYGDSIVSVNLNPTDNTGKWQQFHETDRCEITYETLAAHSFEGTIPATFGVRVADPNILAIIICSHAFMNYTNMWSISHREKAYIRLGELADLFDLAKHPCFKREKFAELTQKFDALDTVAWAVNFTRLLTGKNPLPDFDELIVERALLSKRFPRCLWWNFWAVLNFETDDLIRDRWLSMDKVTDELGFNSICLTDGITPVYATVQHPETRPLERLLTQRDTPFSLRLQIISNTDKIRFHLSLPTDISTNLYRFRLDFGQTAGEISYAPGEQKPSVVGCEMQADVQLQEDGFEFTFTFETKYLQKQLTRVDRFSILIGVALQTADGRLSDSILIPLVVS